METRIAGPWIVFFGSGRWVTDTTTQDSRAPYMNIVLCKVFPRIMVGVVQIPDERCVNGRGTFSAIRHIPLGP